MNDYALDLWQRAARALRTARDNSDRKDYDAAASRAYYAAFYAVSAVFALEEKTFNKHSAVETMFHKELIKSGRLPAQLSGDYRTIRSLRETGDYGGFEHVTGEQAEQAVQAAQRILQAIRQICPPLDRTG